MYIVYIVSTYTTHQGGIFLEEVASSSLYQVIRQVEIIFHSVYLSLCKPICIPVYLSLCIPVQVHRFLSRKNV